MKINATSLLLVNIILVVLSGCATPHSPSSLQVSGVSLTPSHPTQATTDMAVTADGSMLVTAENRTVGKGSETRSSTNLHLWDLVQGRKKGTIAINDLLAITSIALSTDGKKVVVGGRPVKDQASLSVWDLESGRLVRSFPDVKKDLSCVAFSPDNKTLLATHGSYVYIFNAETGEFLQQFDSEVKSSLFSSEKHVLATFSPDGQYIITGGSDGYIKMWEMPSTNKVQHFAGHRTNFAQYGISGIAMSPDNQWLASSGAGDEIARVWEVASGKLLRRVPATSGYSSSIKGITLSPDNLVAVTTGRPATIWEVASGKQIARLRDENGESRHEVQNVLFLPHGKSFLASQSDATVRLYDTATGRERAMLVGFDDGEWIIVTAEGYYNGSAKGASYITVNYNGKGYPMERLFDSFFRPDIVMSALAGEETRNIVPLTLTEAVKNPPPSVTFTSSPNDNQQERINICYQVSNSGGGIGEVRLYQNGKLIVSDGYFHDLVNLPTEKQPLMAMNGQVIHQQMRNLSLSDAGNMMPVTSHEKGQSFADCKEIDTVVGENDFSITAFNKANTLQSDTQHLKFRVSRPAPQPQLYILAIGTTKHKERAVNLKFAAKDALDLATRLSREAALNYPSGKIRQDVLQNDKASKGLILKKVNELAAIIKPEDTFIFFIAGHGILQQSQYYLLTSEYDGGLNATNTLSSNELVDIEKKIKALRQIYLFDSCQAGGVDGVVDSLYEARITVLQRKMGISMFATTSSLMGAFDGYKGNGLFTYSLLNSLNNKEKADSNTDKTMSFSELCTFSQKTIMERSKNTDHLQHPLCITGNYDGPLLALPH